MSFIEELKRRNVVKTGILYAVSGWLILQVADLLFDLMGLPTQWLRLVLALLVLGFPLVLIFSWAYEMTPEGLKLEKDVDRSQSVTAETGHKINRLITVLLVVAIGAVIADRLIPETSETPEAAVDSSPAGDEASSAAASAASDSAAAAAARFAPPPSRSIAVLPFVNMSGEAENEYFADGLSEEILNFLADVPDLRVTARTSSFQFKGRNVDIREVAAALDVAHVLEGSVRRAGDRARITAQLIRAADGYHLWSEAYDRTLEDTFEVQTDIAESVTRALGVVMDERQRERLLATGVRDVEAFILFQRATRMFFDAHSNNIDMAMLGEATELYTQAIEREPRFGAAYLMRSDYAAHIMTMLGPGPEERQAAASRHAEDLDAAVRYSRNPSARALVEADQALVASSWRNLRERLANALAGTGCEHGNWVEVAPVFGLGEASLERRRRMIDCDPLNFFNHYQVAVNLLWLERPTESLQAARRGFEVAPDHPFLEAITVKALIAQGSLDEALASADSITAWNRDVAMILALAAKGDVASARPLYDRVIADAGGWNKMFLVLSLSAPLGDRTAANEAAAWYDALPGGPLMLAGVVLECSCGAPWDLEVTPVFGERLAEAGVSWPPPVRLDYPAMRAGRESP